MEKYIRITDYGMNKIKRFAYELELCSAIIDTVSDEGVKTPSVKDIVEDMYKSKNIKLRFKKAYKFNKITEDTIDLELIKDIDYQIIA